MSSRTEANNVYCAGAGEEEADTISDNQPLLPTVHGTHNQKGAMTPTITCASETTGEKGKLTEQSIGSIKQAIGQCRICLEEDSVSNLENPCGCTGTQQYAHKDCIQRWINEKHHITCEVCEQQYKGSYTVPPPPPDTAGEPLQVVAPLGSLYLTIEDERAAGQLLSDVYDEWDDHRQPTVSWCFSFMMFLLFMMFLHSTMDFSVPGGSDSSSGSGTPSDSSAHDSSAGDIPGGSAAGFAAAASLFLLWLLTKLFLVVLPLMLVMRLAAKAQEQATEAAVAVTSGTMYSSYDWPGNNSISRGGNNHRTNGSSGSNADGSSDRRQRGQQGMLPRWAANRLYRTDRLGARNSNANTGSDSSLTELELEVLQARRAALSRLSRHPALWPVAAAPAHSSAEDNAADGNEGIQQQQQGQQQILVTEQRMAAAIRAMVRAAMASVAHRESNRQRREGGADASGPADADAATVRPSIPSRLSGVV